MKKKGLILFFTLIISAFFSFHAIAQVQSGDIVLGINPKYPKANEEVRASVSTFTTDLNNARISWILDDQTMLEGMGKKTFSFKVGNSGFQTSLEVRIETLSGSVINKKIIISPSGVDMLWEAYDTYTPPFYKGKALVPIEGTIKVVAIPSAQNLAGFTYKWKLDNKNKANSSGYQKNYFTYKNSYLEDNNEVEVAISDIFGNDIGIGNISISLSNPKIIFYQKDQILGTKWESALGSNFSINPSGETIIAEPYFFSSKDLSKLNLIWKINGEQAETPNIKNIMSLKLESGQHGSAVIKVIINNTKTLFQSMEKQIDVNF